MTARSSGTDNDAAAGTYDPAAHTVAEVVAYVETNPDQLQAVYAAEQAGKNRSTLLSALEAML